MGNQPSSGDASRKVGGFMRTTGLLGLSKAELDERCRPSGLYPSCQWEDKAIRKLVGDGKLAARLRGTENRTSPTDRECPICFLQYREVNTTKCCSAYICTECYLQVRPQKAKSYSCPFCNHNKMTVTVAQAMNAEAMLAREETEQRFIEAKIRERALAEEQQQQQSAAAAQAATAANKGFGSSLEQHERLRARSSSLSDHETSSDAMIPEEVLRSSFAMTPEERRSLEDEMRAQHSHPLTLQLEAEAEERRIRNEREYYRQNPASLHAVDPRRSSRRHRGSHGEQPRRNWNQIVEAFERGGHGEVNSLDDLVVLEAAMILSMEEESRRRGTGGGGGGGGGGGSGTNSSATGSGDEDFDAQRHANEGFPLVRSILSGRQSASSRPPDEQQNDQIQSRAHSLYSRRRGRNSLLRAAGAAPDNNSNTALDTAGLLMRGISEDDQLAMAIAASLQDQQQPQQQQQDGEAAEGGESNNEAEGHVAAAAGENEDGMDRNAAEAGVESEAANATANIDSETTAEATNSVAGDADEVDIPQGEEQAQPAANPPGDSLDLTNHGEDDN